MRSRHVQATGTATRATDFIITTEDVPEPDTGQILVRNRFMLLGAVMRTLLPTMVGKTLGTVVASTDPGVPTGASVVHMLGWREYVLLDVAQCRVVDTDDPLLVLSNGLTVYTGLMVAGLLPGETVYVSGAAGAVGSLAGPLARAMGAGRVVGSTGSATKVTQLVERLGYDAGFDHRDPDAVVQELREAAPDIYFDTVGGPLLSATLPTLSPGGRVALCGALAQQLGGAAEPTIDLLTVIRNRLSLHGFTGDPDLEPAYRQLVRERRLIFAHTVVDGLAAAPQALLDLFAGRFVGTVLVRLAE
jgi:NADPH-dependent curcumin reductase CurA